jgi:hypothetical protein
LGVNFLSQRHEEAQKAQSFRTKSYL